MKLSSMFNALSTEDSYAILQLLDLGELNLTDTAKNIHIPISTAQDRLKKLVETNFVFIENKLYYLSSLGKYFLSLTTKFEKVSKLKHIFGEIPSDMIFLQFIENLIPYMEYIDIEESSWHFMSIFDKLLSSFKEKIKNGTFTGVIRIIGWWNLDFDSELLNTYFPQNEFDLQFLMNFISNVNIRLICDKKFGDELLVNDKYYELNKILDEFEYIHILDENTLFNFTIIEIEGTLCMFLVKNNDLDIKHHFFLKHSKVPEIFNILFEYYSKNSLSLSEYIKKYSKQLI